MKQILDVCCGGRMWWHDKADARAIYMDERELECTLCDGRAFRVAPDVIGDFRNIPFADGSFAMVLFDPPHLKNIGENAWAAKKVRNLRNAKFGTRVHSVPYWILKNHNMRCTPTMSEWLMGFPISWTDSAPLATDKFRSWRQRFLMF